MKKSLVGAIVGLSLFVPLITFAATPVHAGGFTTAQVTAVIEMLQAFGVDQATVNEVYGILMGA